MRIMPWFVSIMLMIAGFWFAAYSEDRWRGGGTQWGFALTGVTCILLGTGFAFMIWYRDSSARGPKGDSRHPLE